MFKKSCIFGFLATTFLLPAAALADMNNNVVVETNPVNNASSCVTTPVVVKPNSRNVKVTQRRISNGNVNMRTEVYQSSSTSASTTSTARATKPMCVLPPEVMNNVLILP
ncbi:hypothetical protein [Calothrix sp. UHCC 0171]|uniref:hypothetical protein n=1 Tax=Calothrix sp. UHCC 0171 TaxID=3110245 RepID=UPI002B1F6E24|nr:hypothetical protein [Calothrix sp. UHCC 0171]MEA5573903.1 hypothetical protein [Calothrix sp. UHCC 0171]